MRCAAGSCFYAARFALWLPAEHLVFGVRSPSALASCSTCLPDLRTAHRLACAQHSASDIVKQDHDSEHAPALAPPTCARHIVLPAHNPAPARAMHAALEVDMRNVGGARQAGGLTSLSCVHACVGNADCAAFALSLQPWLICAYCLATRVAHITGASEMRGFVFSSFLCGIGVASASLKARVGHGASDVAKRLVCSFGVFAGISP